MVTYRSPPCPGAGTDAAAPHAEEGTQNRLGLVGRPRPVGPFEPLDPRAEHGRLGGDVLLALAEGRDLGHQRVPLRVGLPGTWLPDGVELGLEAALDLLDGVERLPGFLGRALRHD